MRPQQGSDAHDRVFRGIDFMRHVSVVIPALNEENTVASVVSAIQDEAPGEIIVIGRTPRRGVGLCLCREKENRFGAG